MLQRGVSDAMAFLVKYHAAAEASDEGAARAAGCPCTAGIDITNAIGEINYLIPSARLPELG